MFFTVGGDQKSLKSTSLMTLVYYYRTKTTLIWWRELQEFYCFSWTRSWTCLGSPFPLTNFLCLDFSFHPRRGRPYHPFKIGKTELRFLLKISLMMPPSFLWPPPKLNFYAADMQYKLPCLLAISASVHLFSPARWFIFWGQSSSLRHLCFPNDALAMWGSKWTSCGQNRVRPLFKIRMYYLDVICKISIYTYNIRWWWWWWWKLSKGTGEWVNSEMQIGDRGIYMGGRHRAKDKETSWLGELIGEREQSRNPPILHPSLDSGVLGTDVVEKDSWKNKGEINIVLCWEEGET